jgi:hypothetical protein
MVRALSADAVSLVPGEVDFVYVDADHSCRAVWSDLCHWYSKVRAGGVIGGHDYDHPDHPGVKLAVDEFCARVGTRAHAEGEGVWWAERPPTPDSAEIGSFDCRFPWHVRARHALGNAAGRLWGGFGA